MIKIFLLSLFIQITSLHIFSYTINFEENNFLIVEVITPAKRVYDDGIYRNLFSSFYVLDIKGNKIVSSGEVFDYPAKIKLKEGNYTIFYFTLTGKLAHRELYLKKGNMIEIKLD